MSIIKLTEAGESVTWTIKQAESVAGQFGAQVKFENTDGDIIFLPAESAARQLNRIPLTIPECAGETLVISRDPNPKPGAKPYWGIRVAGPTDKQPPVSKRLPPPEAKKPLPFDEDSFPPEEYGASVHSPEPDPYLPTGKAPTPHRVTPQPTIPQQVPTDKQAKRAVLEDEYLALLTRVKQRGVLADENAVQATAASIFIAWQKAGLV